MSGKRIAIVTDAWHPQVNGVVRTLETTGAHLIARGHEVEFISPQMFRTLPRPIHIYMGRVAVEKNIEAFLPLPLWGSKIVIGDGPDREKLLEVFTDTHFLGPRFGRDLARHLAGGDVFVFPSHTDTFGLVLLEAMACGLPVAAYPVQGPVDVVADGRSGVLDADLKLAISGALKLNRDDCVAHASQFAWEKCSEIFESQLAFH